MPDPRVPDRIHQCFTNMGPGWGSFKTLDIIIVMDTQIDQETDLISIDEYFATFQYKH